MDLEYKGQSSTALAQWEKICVYPVSPVSRNPVCITLYCTLCYSSDTKVLV